MESELIWNDAESFKQHIASMKIFSQSHPVNSQGKCNPFEDKPNACNIHATGKPARTKVFITTRGKPALAPIWEIELPKGSQN
jgi:hypothetical protein